MKILAIEDEAIAGMQLVGVLKSLGHEATLVQGTIDAWKQLGEGGFRVVVSDWRMPGLSGLDLCRMIRNRGGDYIYFILISSTRVTSESRREALEAGVDDFLSKPIDPDELGMRLHVAQRILNFTTQVQQLESFLPICGYCKKIRDDQKYWHEVEAYFNQQQGTRFSHGICPDCYTRVVEPQLRELGIVPQPPPAEPAP